MTDVADPEANVPVEGKVATGVGLRFAVGFAVAVALSLAVSLVALDRAGVSARVVPATAPPIVVVNDAKGLLDAWNKAGLHGVELVDVTRDLGYAIPVGALPRTSGWPVPLLDLQTVFNKTAGRSSAVWVASKTGIARNVTYVLPPAELVAKVRTGRENGYPGISPDGRLITANDDGYLRWIGDVFPSNSAESAVLNIDASYFVKGTPEGLVGQLDKSGVSYRFVTLNRSNDATDVPPAARVKLNRMADMLRSRGPK